MISPEAWDKATAPDDEPLVGVVVHHSPPELLVTIDTEGDDTHNWMKIGWIANDGLVQVQD